MWCVQVVQQALHALRRMGDVLGGVLAPREFVRVAGTVVQTLADRAVGACTTRHSAANISALQFANRGDYEAAERSRRKWAD